MRDATGARRPLLLLAAAAAALATAACSGRAPVPMRPEPVPYADTLPVEEPAEREPLEAGRLFLNAVGAQPTRPFDLRRGADARHEALNLTRFDDVVNSSWYEHRIDAPGGLSPREVGLGPARTPPDTTGPLTIVAGKSAGISPGFTVRDASGRRYLFKFDPEGHLHLASSADVVSSRLLWAAGYHVPEEYKVTFDPDRLALSEGAEVSDEGGDRPMRPEDVAAILARTDSLADGRYVALASRFVPGVPKGPFHFEGVREDDPNDHYRHEHRRELRGLYVLSAWLNHVDVRFANTLAAYVAPGYLRHYLIDLAATLGSGTVRPHRPREGAEYNFAFWPSLARLVTLGFYRAGWEGREPEPLHPAVGWMRVEDFDPAGWRPNWPNRAFWNMTERDAYWAAKLVAAFDREDVRAAVAAAELPDPAAADTLVDAIVTRRDRTVAHWFRRVTPLEDPAVLEPGGAGGPALAFRDLALEEGLADPGETRYSWRFSHPARGVDRRGTSSASEGVRQRIGFGPGDERRAGGGGAPPAGGRAERAGGATVGEAALARLEVTALRPGWPRRAAVVHLRWSGPDEGYAVVGLEH